MRENTKRNKGGRRREGRKTIPPPLTAAKATKEGLTKEGEDST
jgi:hypothetical protein